MNSRLYTVLVVTVIILASLVVVLPGTLKDNNVAQVDGVQHLTSFEAGGPGGLLFTEDFSNLAAWKVASEGIQTSLSAHGSLNLSIAFESKSVSQAVSMSRSLNVSLDDFPFVTMKVTVSQGFAYGTRFFGTLPNGTSFSAWHEGSPTQHRKGQGTQEVISVDLLLESFLSTGSVPPTHALITRFLLYVEAVPQTSGNFYLVLNSMSVRSTVRTHVSTMRVEGNYRYLVMTLNASVPSQEIFQVFVSFEISGSSELEYTPLLMDNMSVVAKGATYHITAASNYVLAVLRPTASTALGTESAPVLTGTNSTSLVIFAEIGSITTFNLQSIALRYSAQTPAFQGTVSDSYGQYLMIYYVVFLFVTPVAAVVLLETVFRHETQS